MMLNNGIDPMWVSATLGHENVKITLEIYAHFFTTQGKNENRVFRKTVQKRYTVIKNSL
jgi:site-specific recombinase XerD